MKVSMDKRYRYKNKKLGVARILYNDGSYTADGVWYPVVSMDSSGLTILHQLNGYYLPYKGSDYDLIEISKYEDFKTDEPVIVSAKNGPWFHRYFSGIDEKGNPQAFKHGATSFSNSNNPTTWYKCEKYTGHDNE